MISETIQKQIHQAMKAKASLRLETLKMLSTALTNAEIAKKRVKLTEEEEIKVVKSEAKKRKDAIELYKKGEALDKAKKEELELKILEEYLPEEMAESELEKIVTETIQETGTNSIADMGKVMGAVMAKVAGKADGGRVSEIVKKKLR
ncbi:hypothetical protein A2Z22_04115 [Candidatus Woesebacteria bacterium RBG_16_34_12]|uniref:Glutamyl-tRNA amidotransferase n=1 Tax=Candidatus Woesebacteria bacterium RBG_16_34_12 TaxID=1802480 RepID=A0A1F7X7G9_9BACT|nr:MAG: hypothetical protein A2Z22_04115 [Candidatus Woesebacteria bacterium RBG_16_34_12]